MSIKLTKSRSEIPAEYQWKLEDMFATDEEWEQECEKIVGLCGELEQYQGKLGDSARILAEYLEKSDRLDYYMARNVVYSNERYHQDTKVSKYQGYAAKSDTLGTMAAAAVSFSGPEILEIPEEVLQAFYEEEPRLEHYRRVLNEIRRGKEHTLSKEQEALLAAAGDIAVGPSNIFAMINDADMKFPSVTDSDGNRIPVTHGNFILLLNNKDRNVREQAFHSLYHTYGEWGNTIAATFVAHLKQENFFAKSRRYSSVRGMHLDHGNIPESVYDNLIETVHKHLPALHRYVSIRKKLLGLDELHMYDLYLPMVDAVDMKFTYEEAKELVAKALEPMGEEYGQILKEGFSGGWVDVYENENKRSGAYSWSAYGTHPYVLMNYQGDLDSVFTFAHEMGHAIHSYYSNKTQSVTYCNYLIFVAEVASTCNESLLTHYLLSTTEDEKELLYLTNHYLESFRTTLFRQAMFAEFEHIVHTRLAAGEALTKESISAIYHDLNVQYYGPDIVVDPEIDWEWMRIPHFYTSYYVYQYSTGYSAAIAFSKKILEEGEPAVKRYVENFLCGGCSKDPIDLLAAAGVDMSTPKPVDDALTVFEQYLDSFEKQIS